MRTIVVCAGVLALLTGCAVWQASPLAPGPEGCLAYGMTVKVTWAPRHARVAGAGCVQQGPYPGMKRPGGQP